VDWKLELVVVPVGDVDLARDFYVRAGFALDHDHTVSDEIRFVQLTPPGSACSIALGQGLTDAPLGSARAQIVVADVRRAREELVARGVEVSEVEDLPWGSFAFFADPDGNRWSLQQLPPRT
jgi:catechol 2,3-dioxygenase-like lactoylglutathione lyase family enzyme